MKVVVLCGGFGTRLREGRGLLPKPLVEIGGQPLLRHVLKGYADCGFKEFILCLGYGGALIRKCVQSNRIQAPSDWIIECVDTGLSTNTGERIKRIELKIREDTFFATYADGVSDIDIGKLFAFHRRHGRIGTMTAVSPVSQFGEVVISAQGRVTEFVEKPRLNRWVNGGFFVFHRRFFGYLRKNSILEKEPLESMSRDGELFAYRHTGFWCCMDTYKDTVSLNELCKKGDPPWLRKKKG